MNIIYEMKKCKERYFFDSFQILDNLHGMGKKREETMSKMPFIRKNQMKDKTQSACFQANLCRENMQIIRKNIFVNSILRQKKYYCSRSSRALTTVSNTLMRA